jgi:hypothetical protein
MRHETEFCFMRTVLRDWKDGKAHLQDLQWVGRQDRVSEFSRSQAMASHTQTCCFPEHDLAQQHLGGIVPGRLNHCERSSKPKNPSRRSEHSSRAHFESRDDLAQVVLNYEMTWWV